MEGVLAQLIDELKQLRACCLLGLTDHERHLFTPMRRDEHLCWPKRHQGVYWLEPLCAELTFEEISLLWSEGELLPSNWVRLVDDPPGSRISLASFMELVSADQQQPAKGWCYGCCAKCSTIETEWHGYGYEALSLEGHAAVSLHLRVCVVRVVMREGPVVSNGTVGRLKVHCKYIARTVYGRYSSCRSIQST